jgi:cyclophilin family peptidyl-prolyl cis-trans isomerase/uncharacterized damage-inducible protein DinB
MSGALLELYRHKTWATLRLIEYCQGLGDEHLDSTTPGTYGTIRETLRHLVDSEEGYYKLLTGEQVSEPLAERPIPLDELAERIRRLGGRWEAAAEDADLPAHDVRTSDGWRLPGSVPMGQAIHHADDHRSHVLSIIGARGLEVPELDMWAYAQSHHRMQLDPSRKFSAHVKTTRGNLVIALGGSKADRRTANRFVYIAQDNFYNGLSFHRASGLVVVGDVPIGEKPAPSNPSIWPCGTVGMGSSPTGEIGPGFFITDADTEFQDAEVYTCLGEVTTGLEVVEEIQAGDTIISLEISVV